MSIFCLLVRDEYKRTFLFVQLPTGCATSLLLRSRTGVRASLMALTFASGSRAVAPSTASDAVHNAVHGAFMTLPATIGARRVKGMSRAVA